MRTELNAKFIQHINPKHSETGFTLVELLVVIIILGILGAVALPSFLNQDVKAKQTEAKQNVVLINKTQNSFRAENSQFASSFNILAIGSVTDSAGVGSGTTSNYAYTLNGGTDTTAVTASARDTALRSYSGGDVRFSNGSNQSVIGTVLCETIAIGNAATAPNTTGGASPTCMATEKTLNP